MILFALWLQAAPPADRPVEQTKKNIKVLQGMPSSQLIPVMAFMANSLGVTCAHCHTAAWESDEKPAKNAARDMIAMQRKINDQQYGGKLTVTCNTCHHGSVKPQSVPDVADAGWQTRTTATESLVPAEEAIGRLTRAPEGVTKRVVRGTVERYSGRDEPKSAPFTLTVDGGKVSYETALSHPPEASRALAIYALTPPPAERLRGERWRIVDGDLTRRYRETPTPLGILPDEIDYADYRDAAGVRLPYRAQWSRADYRVTYIVEKVE